MSTEFVITAPWTEDQVATLNAFQHSGLTHPFTCGAEHDMHQTLIAEPDGWHCPDADCSYTQDWALSVMADPEYLARANDWYEKLRLSIRQEPLSAELKRVNALLRRTEDQLAEARAQIASLNQKNRAMQLVLSRVTQAQKAGLSPSVADTAGDCDAVWILGDTGGRSIEDVDTGDAL